MTESCDLVHHKNYSWNKTDARNKRGTIEKVPNANIWSPWHCIVNLYSRVCKDNVAGKQHLVHWQLFQTSITTHCSMLKASNLACCYFWHDYFFSDIYFEQSPFFMIVKVMLYYHTKSLLTI